MPPPEERRLSLLPSRRARALAFAAILVAGTAGALIGASLVRIQCRDCSTAAGAGAVVGALVAAGGVAVVAVLVLRAMNEWRRLATTEGVDDEVAPDGGDGVGPVSPG